MSLHRSTRRWTPLRGRLFETTGWLCIVMLGFGCGASTETSAPESSGVPPSADPPPLPPKPKVIAPEPSKPDMSATTEDRPRVMVVIDRPPEPSESKFYQTLENLIALSLDPDRMDRVPSFVSAPSTDDGNDLPSRPPPLPIPCDAQCWALRAAESGAQRLLSLSLEKIETGWIIHGYNIAIPPRTRTQNVSLKNEARSLEDPALYKGIRRVLSELAPRWVLQEGTRPKAEFENQLSAHKSKVRQCYGLALRTDAGQTMPAEVRIALEVMPNGRVRRVYVNSEPLPTDLGDRCTALLVKKWRFRDLLEDRAQKAGPTVAHITLTMQRNLAGASPGSARKK